MHIPTPRSLLARFLAAVAFLFLLIPAFANQVGRQKVTIIATNVPLETIFKSIEQQTGLRFIYSVDAINVEEKVSVSFKKAMLDDVLEALLKQRSVSWQYREGVISLRTIKEATPATTTTGVIDPPPLITITGRVLDAAGTPVPGATVAVKGVKNKGTKTDGDGNFVLRNISPNTVLQISFIGFETRDVAVEEKRMTIRMKEVAGKLDETIIVGYQKTSPRFYTGNVTSVKSEEIEMQPVSDPLLALQGRVPGMVINQTTGLSGGQIKVQVRGINSLNNGTQPLFIVDGVPYQPSITAPPTGNYGALGSVISALNFINPSDIESIDVLKDADATAIYGSRGANGVILITTKKGVIGDPRVNVTFNEGFQNVAKRIEFLNTSDYLKMRREAFRNDGVTPDASSAPDLFVWDTTRYTDWQKVMIGNQAHYTDAQASISGGSNTIQYLIGSDYHRETTIYPGDFSSQRGGAHFNVSGASLDQKLKANLTGSYIVNKTNFPGADFASSMNLPPDAPPIFTPDGQLNWANSTWQNPFSQLKSSTLDAQTSNLVTNIDVTCRLFAGLILRANIGYNELRSNTFSGTLISGSDPKIQNNLTASAVYTNTDLKSWITEPQISYSIKLGSHNIDALIGSTLLGNTLSNQTVYESGIEQDAFIRNPGAGNYYYLAGTGSKYKYAAFLSRVGYNYRDKYLLNLTARRDGSSRFGPRDRFANFWSIGSAWIFSQEELAGKLFPALSFGKIRASYGITGNDQIGDYQYIDQYQFVEQNYQGAKGLRETGVFNPNFAWERTKKSEIALETGFLKDHILFTISYYHTHSDNQLISYPLPAITGSISVIGNQPATINNNGIEISFTSKNIQTKKISWTSSFNFAFNRNKLVSFDATRIFLPVKKGHSLSERNLYKEINVDPTLGTYLFADENGKPVSSSFAYSNGAYVDLAPRFYGGFQNSLKFGDFQIDILFQYVKQKGALALFNPDWLPGMLRNQPIAALKSWKGVGDDKAEFQRFNQDYSLLSDYGVWINSNKAYGDASFIRCKNISLSWNLFEKWEKSAHINNCRVFVHAQNLFTLTKYPGWDPETQSMTVIPPLRTITFGAQFTL
jgi:TonB-linked SusC/RagA family outer membrane protein